MPRMYEHFKRREWDHIFRKIGLTRTEVADLYDVYRQIDEDGTAGIDVDEFLNYFGVDQTREFARRLFNQLDQDRSGDIDFMEFVCAVFNFAVITPDAMPKFLFKLYDEDGSQLIEFPELASMLGDMMGRREDNRSKTQSTRIDKHTQAEIRKMLELVKKNSKGDFDKEALQQQDFNLLLDLHFDMFAPVYDFQRILRTKCLGMNFWRKQIKAFKAKAMVPMVHTNPDGTLESYLYGNIMSTLPKYIALMKKKAEQEVQDRECYVRYGMSTKEYERQEARKTRLKEQKEKREEKRLRPKQKGRIGRYFEERRARKARVKPKEEIFNVDKIAVFGADDLVEKLMIEDDGYSKEQVEEVLKSPEVKKHPWVIKLGTENAFMAVALIALRDRYGEDDSSGDIKRYKRKKQRWRAEAIQSEDNFEQKLDENEFKIDAEYGAEIRARNEEFAAKMLKSNQTKLSFMGPGAEYPAGGDAGSYSSLDT